MRVPLDWLTDFVDPGLPTEQLAERLALTGTEVDRVLHHGVSALEHFVVGRVLSAEQHPDADRLRVCSVDIGTGEPSGIVCGAPNVAAGQLVGVARPGAVMPDGTKLKKAKLRGVASEGMILSEREVEVGVGHDGIMELEGDAAPGTPLLDVLPISTDVLELEITPNRPDCLAIYGVAREVHAATGAELAPPPWAEDPGTGGQVDGVTVEVEVPELCPRFTARAFDDVTIGDSPPWLKARLMAAGQRPINNVVDITNYVMLLTGQPLHAFDLDRVAGGRLVVRAAREGEEVETLDGQVRTLHADEIVIDDADGPTSLAGVMGGARSEVSGETTTVLLEVASWHAPTIQRTSSRLALRSEASSRFEKGLSVELTMEAQAVATQLMVELCGATVRPGTVDVGGAPSVAPVLRLREARVNALLGAEIARARQSEILTALGFGVRDADDGLDVEIPHFRRMDVTREADLVEEVARIDGVDRLPSTLPSRRGASGRLTRVQRARRRAEDVLVGRGLHEIVGWSFTEPGVADRLRLAEDDPRRAFVPLTNPMSEDQSVLRTTMLGSLLDVARHNTAHGNAELRLFEAGAIYLDQTGGPASAGHVAGSGTPGGEKLPLERHALGAVLSGPVTPSAWRAAEELPWDVFAAKALVGAVLDTLRAEWDVRPGTHPFLHPGRSGRIFTGETELGWVGEVHPLVTRAWELDATVAAFELDLDLAIDASPDVDAYTDVTSFPAVRQDLALVMGEDVSSDAVIEILEGTTLVESVEVFDVYRGEQVGEGKVSLALHLSFRAPDRTLTDEDVKRSLEKALRALESLGAVQRG